MMELTCRNEKRRIEVRKSAKKAGFDYLEVSEDHLRLRVYFLGMLPATPLTVENFRVEGGRRIRGLRVTNVFLKQFHEAELDDYVDVIVDRFGDYSTYTLRAVARVNELWVPHPGFDPLYNQLDFTFTAGCATDLDCPSEEPCPPDKRTEPAINYLAKDYASFRQLIFDRLAVVMPEWKNRFVADIGVTLVEILAYAGDYLSYYQDAVATEAYLATARQRISVRRHARLVDYQLHEGCNARALLVVAVSGDLTIQPGEVQFITPPATDCPTELSRRALASISLGPYEIFEPMTATNLYLGHETISFYTWGDAECCLPRGATSATLKDEEPSPGQRKLKLGPGNFLIFEEVLGPKTGLAADRDAAHRWPVRLTKAQAGVDPLNDTPVLHVEWSEEDALPFPLCISSIGPAPGCVLLTDVSVARGNVVLVDHGASMDEELPPVKIQETPPACEGEKVVGETTRLAAPFRPRLTQANVMFQQAPAANASVAQLFVQDPHAAQPSVTLNQNSWTAGGDLLRSRPMDQRFVVEMDNERVAWLRFGDGTHGAMPPLAPAMKAHYRVAGGTAGNVGAEAIVHVLWPSNVSQQIQWVRNPLPARGGIDPQPIEEAKLLAPRTFRTRLERAVTAADYATIAQREFPLIVQRAAATLRWNGSWHEALVAIDAFGAEQASPGLLRRIWKTLSAYRRIGHDLRVEAAVRVPICIVLSICVKATYLRAHVSARLKYVFGTGSLPDGRLGFFHPDNLTFGAALYLSQVVSLAQSVPGVESVRVLTFERMFEGPRGEKDAGLISLGPFEIAQCNSDPSFPEDGKIQFQIGGGR